MEPTALLESVIAGDTGRVRAVLEAGADINGYPDLPIAPLMAAVARDAVSMVRFLIDLGAGPDRPADHEIPVPNSTVTIMPGERALHLAARRGNVEIVSLLLKRARANPNATDHTGGTPLMVACTCPVNYVAVVRLLLEAGANPALTEQEGFTAMHLVAQHGGHLKLVKMLYAKAPATLNAYSNLEGESPLYLACVKGNEDMVDRLLSLGAMQQGKCKLCPLGAATIKDHVAVVRMLLWEGLGVVGGPEVLPTSLFTALRFRRPKILQLLLTAGREEAPIMGGEGELVEWANVKLNRKSLLHHGTGFCCPGSVSVLLAAGADETKGDLHGRIPRDIIGVELRMKGLPIDHEKELAIRRMLEQASAYRARSWAWPEADGDGFGDAGDAILSSPPAAPKGPVGVRIFRPKSDRKLFMSLVGRYCEKGYFCCYSFGTT